MSARTRRSPGRSPRASQNESFTTTTYTANDNKSASVWRPLWVFSLPLEVRRRELEVALSCTRDIDPLRKWLLR